MIVIIPVGETVDANKNCNSNTLTKTGMNKHTANEPKTCLLVITLEINT